MGIEIKSGRNGFTLIEMLTVMAIMLLMMTFAMVNFINWGRGAAMRGATLNLKSNLVSARQWAITHRTRTYLVYGNCASPSGIGQSGFYVVSNVVDGLIGSTNFLPTKVLFVKPGFVQTDIENVGFKMDGTCVGDISLLQYIGVGNQTATNYLKIYPLTGRAKQVTTPF